MEKNPYKKIRETHTIGHAPKKVLTNNMWIWQIGRLVSLFYSFKYLLFDVILFYIITHSDNNKISNKILNLLGSLSFNILMPCNSFLV